MTNLTKPDISRQLTVDQENAADLVVQGMNDREVGEKVGVSRQTVNEWRNHNPAFIAAVNARRQELWGQQLDRLRGLLGQAVDVLASDLDCGDLRLRQAAAVHILRGAGLLGESVKPSGPTTAESVARQRRIREAAEKEQDTLASLMARF